MEYIKNGLWLNFAFMHLWFKLLAERRSVPAP